MTDSTATLQQQLAAAGFDPGPVDGWHGGKTTRALMAAAIQDDSVPLEAGAALYAALRKYGLNTPPRTIEMIANCGAESRFKLVEENLNYSPERLMQVWPRRFPNIGATQGFAHNPRQLANAVYGGRMGNRPNTPDGFDFRGRSWPQLTGRGAYDDVGKITGLPLLDDPGLLMTYPGAAEGACGFWIWKNLSPFADARRSRDLRIQWNGGTNGLQETLRAVDRLETLWGV